MRLRLRPTKKQSRQDAIAKAVRDKSIRTQDELKRTIQKLGFNVTQSSLSRDIAELGLFKQRGCYILPPSGAPHPNTPKPVVTSIEAAGNSLLVIKTFAGMAAPVGITIDSKKIRGIIGTVAGDDTVFAATSPAASHDAIKKAVRKLFKGA